MFGKSVETKMNRTVYLTLDIVPPNFKYNVIFYSFTNENMCVTFNVTDRILM
jgi:hypothetical protein